MKKNIVFGSLLTIFLLLMIPVLPAMEYQNSNQTDGICSFCQEWDPLLCLIDLAEYIWNIVLFVVLFLTIIFIPYAIDAFWSAQNALNHAKVIDCLWAKFLPSFPLFSLALLPIPELT
jgi:hypothetical protein